MKKLLSKTLFYYGLFSVGLLLAGSPIFYLVMERLFLEDVDEALILRRNEFLKTYAPTLRQKDIAIWNHYNRDLTILPAGKPLKKDIIFQQAFYDTLYQEWEPYRVLESPLRLGESSFRLQAKISLIESEDLLFAIAQWFLGLVVVLLVGLFLLTQRLSATLWKPFHLALDRLQAFELDQNQWLPLPATTIQEFSRLNQTLNLLIENNLNSYRTQKRFTENAAHELQTPLAVLQAKLELLAQQADLTEPQAHLIESLQQAAGRLWRLNKNLLLLAKLESGQFMEKKDISLTTLLGQQIDFFHEQAQAAGIEMHTEPLPEVNVSAHPVFTEILLSNLLANALRHNHQSGSVSICLKNKLLTICNTGVLEALSTHTLFKRFGGTTHPAKGNGLGLSLVKKIADINGWHVSYHFENNQHTFSVQF